MPKPGAQRWPLNVSPFSSLSGGMAPVARAPMFKIGMRGQSKFSFKELDDMLRDGPPRKCWRSTPLRSGPSRRWVAGCAR
jgi:hypothetical protein